MIGLATFQYRRDFNGAFPAISHGVEGWADDLEAYTEWSAFQCPEGNSPSQLRSSDYFYNALLAESGEPLDPATTISFGDGYDNSGANAHLSELPFDWRDNENSAANRHRRMANYCFADGHVKSLFASAIFPDPQNGDRTTPYTFKVAVTYSTKSE